MAPADSVTDTTTLGAIGEASRTGMRDDVPPPAGGLYSPRATSQLALPFGVTSRVYERPEAGHGRTLHWGRENLGHPLRGDQSHAGVILHPLYGPGVLDIHVGRFGQ